MKNWIKDEVKMINVNNWKEFNSNSIKQALSKNTFGNRFNLNNVYSKFSSEDKIEAGYYDFIIDNLLFTNCFIEACEKINNKFYYRLGSYYVETI